MHKSCSTHSKVLKLLLLLAGIATFYYVEAQMSQLYTTQECNRCIKDGHVACRTSRDDTLGICCNPNGMDIEQCDAEAGKDGKENENFSFCTSNVNDPSSNSYACTYQGGSLQGQ